MPPKRRAVVDLAGKAAWAFATQHPDAAAAGYKQLLAQYPTEPGVHYAYGLYLMETDSEAALVEFQKGSAEQPEALAGAACDRVYSDPAGRAAEGNRESARGLEVRAH